MNKREFLKASGMALTGAVMERTVSAAAQGTPAQTQAQAAEMVHPQAGVTARKNWSGNYVYSTDRLLEPATTEEVQAAVRAGKSLRALGSQHSFNGIADSTVEQVSVKRMKSMELDAAAKTVTVGGGVRYGDLAPWLDGKGYALHNLASLPHISVVGACTTGTHGSGVRNGNLSTAVAAVEFVDAKGEVVRLSRAKDGDRMEMVQLEFCDFDLRF